MRTLRDWLTDAPFHLRLSSGYFGFYAHAGFLRALFDAGIRPQTLGGSSAGAIASGLTAAGLSVDDVEDALYDFRREDFWDPAPGLGLLRGRKLRALLEARLPVRRFEECKTPLAVSVFDVVAGRTRVVQHGPIAPAIQASAALPGLFQPVWLHGRPMLDGGIRDWTSLATAPPSGARVFLHHLIARPSWHSSITAEMRPRPRSGLVRLSVQDLPRLGPFKLDRGPDAYRRACDATTRALDRTVDSVMLI